MATPIRIGTRDSQLALWQARQVQELLNTQGNISELVLIKSEGDQDLITPLYEMGVQGIFTRSLDAALLNNRIDIAVHSMKDVPVILPPGIQKAAVLKRASVEDILVWKGDWNFDNEYWFVENREILNIATSSIRRKAQWLHRFPKTEIHNLRGNVNTRLRKLQEENWDGAIFAAAGLERIGLRPQQSINMDWMLPAPAQGAILVVCREKDDFTFNACQPFSDKETDLCTSIERNFLKKLQGGCTAPISALARIVNDQIQFDGNIFSTDGKEKASVSFLESIKASSNLGEKAAEELLKNGGEKIAREIRNEQ